MQTTVTYKKTTFRDNHIFVLNYPIHLCVNAKFNTLYLRQYILTPVDFVTFKMTFKFKIEPGIHPSQFPHTMGDSSSMDTRY